MHSIPFGKSADAPVSIHSIQHMQYKGLADPLVCGLFAVGCPSLLMSQNYPTAVCAFHKLSWLSPG